MEMETTMPKKLKKQIFSFSGPVDLKNNVDWTNPCDQKSVAACLVQAVYVMEFDLKNNRKGSQALAPPWWEAFHFEGCEGLTDDTITEPNIFGAVFTLAPQGIWNRIKEFKRGRGRNILGRPRCVVAFRGTQRKEDLKLDLNMIMDKLQLEARCEKALEAVKAAVEEFGVENVWMAGHSLGAAIPLLAGRTMAKKGVLLKNSFLFNRPFVSASLGMIIGSGRVMGAIRFAGNLLTAGVAVLMGKDEEAPFEVWSEWQPWLFVNDRDLICKGYINYFEGRESGRWGRLASQYTLSSLFSGREPTRLISSAHLTVNSGTVFTKAHKIYQWWKPHLLPLKTTSYNFRNQS